MKVPGRKVLGQCKTHPEKTHFEDREAAHAAALQASFRTSGSLELHPYDCPDCGWWHLSSRK